MSQLNYVESTLKKYREHDQEMSQPQVNQCHHEAMTHNTDSHTTARPQLKLIHPTYTTKDKMLVKMERIHKTETTRRGSNTKQSENLCPIPE